MRLVTQLPSTKEIALKVFKLANLKVEKTFASKTHWITFCSKVLSNDSTFICSFRRLAWKAVCSDLDLARTWAISVFALRFKWFFSECTSRYQVSFLIMFYYGHILHCFALQRDIISYSRYNFQPLHLLYIIAQKMWSVLSFPCLLLLIRNVPTHLMWIPRQLAEISWPDP